MFALILLFRLSCDLYYKYSFAQTYSYYLFEYDFSIKNYLVSWLFTILLSMRFAKAFKRGKPEKLSSYIIYTLFLLSFIPTMTLCSYENFSFKFMFLVVGFWTMTLLLEYFFCAKNTFKTCFQTGIKTQISFQTQNVSYIFICFLVAFSVIGFSYHYTGFKLNLNLNNIYDLRYGEIRSLSGPLQYFYIWVGIAISVLCVFAFQRKKYGQFAVWALLILLYFSIEGNKISLFVVPVSLVAIACNLKKNMWLIPIAFILLNVMGIFEVSFLKLNYINGYWGLRTLFLPSNLSQMYFDYFSIHGPDYWARSFLRHFGAVSKYEMDFGHLIDIEYFKLSGAGNSNNGLFGAAYANFGDLCVIVYPIVLLAVFLLINWFTKSIKIEHCYVFLIYYTMTLQNADPFVVLMTNGLLVIGLLYKFVLTKKFHSRKLKGHKNIAYEN